MIIDQKHPISWSLVERGADGRKVMKDPALTKPFLYHMLEWRYAKVIFETNKLRLSPVRSWQDPYERWWCDGLFNRPGPLSGFQPYGSCWTTGAHDEPRWRMAGFGPDKETPVVRIRCRVDAMVNAAKGLLKNGAGSAFLGRVQYRGERTLVRLAQSVAEGEERSYPDGRDHAVAQAACLQVRRRGETPLAGQAGIERGGLYRHQGEDVHRPSDDYTSRKPR